MFYIKLLFNTSLIRWTFFFWNYCSFYHSHWIVYLIISPFGIFEILKTYNKHKNNAILKNTICSILTTNLIIFWISKLVRIRVRYFSILPYSLINRLDWLLFNLSVFVGMCFTFYINNNNRYITGMLFVPYSSLIICAKNHF